MIYLTQAIALSAMVFFIYICYRPHMIFGFLNNFYKKYTPEVIWKPLFDCPWCMSPWYGTLLYWIFFHESIKDWFLSVGIASGFITFFICFYNMYMSTRDMCDYIEECKDKITKD